MNELTEGHLITLCDEALHTQLTHISLISRYEGGGGKKKLLSGSRLLTYFLPPLPGSLCANPHGDKKGRNKESTLERLLEKQRDKEEEKREL